MAFFLHPETYRRRLDAAASSELYQRRLAEMVACLKSVKGRLIALDIEGTLTTKTLPHHLRGRWRKWWVRKRAGHDRFWLRRPLAQELITALIDNRNRVVLWTVANMPTAREILATSGLELGKATLLTKEHNRKMLQDKGLYGRLVDWPEGGIKQPVNEKCKLPSIFQVHALLDDKAVSYHRPFVKAIEPENLERLVHVPAFAPRTFREMREALTDWSLVNAARGLRDAVKSAR